MSRNRNTPSPLIDQEKNPTSAFTDEKKNNDDGNNNNNSNRLIIIVYIILWYGFSITLSVYNKWLFSIDGVDFNYPIFSTSIHQFVQFIIAYIITKFLRHNDHANTTTDWNQYLRKLLPCAAASAGDIGMGNLSLRTITLSFYTMVKSSNLGFVLLFSFLFRLERPNWRLISIIIIMSIGVIMMVAGEAQFNLFGFILVMGAACCSGLRWSLTQILMLRDNNNTPQQQHDPISTILNLTPLMGIMIFISSMIIEGPLNILKCEFFLTKGYLHGLTMLITPGIIAFYMTLSEFYLLSKTSVLSLSIAGIFKELLTISFAYLFFDDTLTPINATGLIITLLAIIAYNGFRYQISQARE